MYSSRGTWIRRIGNRGRKASGEKRDLEDK
jgi:hypothetical protein